MIYVVVNSSKIELPTAKMYFSDLRGNRSVARPSSAIQMLETTHQRSQQVFGSITVPSVTFEKHTVPWEHNPPVRPHRCCGNNTTGK